MRTLDWDAILCRQELFRSIDEADRRALLDESISAERVFRKDEVILRQGDLGTSIFVIGQGAASISLHRPDGETIGLSTMREGAVFGEMAAIENRPRTATIAAIEDTTVLEIKGDAFMKLLRRHGELALMLLASMSQRLRHTDQRVAEQRISGLDQSVAALSSRIDAVMQASEANLAASQAMFDQTKLRANEIIDSAARARSQMTWVGSIILALISVIGTVGLMDVKQMRSGVEEDRKEVARILQDIQPAKTQVEDFLAQLKDAQDQISTAETRIADALVMIQATQEKLATPRLLAAIGNSSYSDEAKSIFVRAMTRFDPATVKAVASALTASIRAGADLAEILEDIRRRGSYLGPDGRTIGPDGEVFLLYFTALSAIRQADQSDFARVVDTLQAVISRNAGQIAPPGYALGEAMTASLTKPAGAEDAANGARDRMIAKLQRTMAPLH